MIVWLKSYSPFILGGDVHAPLSTDIEELGLLYDLGKGHHGYLIINPNDGKTFVVEAKSGGIIGVSLEGVRKDIAAGDSIVMDRQITRAIGQREKVEVVDNETFWARFSPPNAEE